MAKFIHRAAFTLAIGRRSVTEPENTKGDTVDLGRCMNREQSSDIERFVKPLLVMYLYRAFIFSRQLGGTQEEVAKVAPVPHGLCSLCHERKEEFLRVKKREVREPKPQPLCRPTAASTAT